MSRNITSAWVDKPNSDELARQNREAYQEIKDLAKVERIGSGYATARYKVVDNSNGLSDLELALIADGGNLCFGYRMEGPIIVIYTD